MNQNFNFFCSPNHGGLAVVTIASQREGCGFKFQSPDPMLSVSPPELAPFRPQSGHNCAINYKSILLLGWGQPTEQK